MEVLNATASGSFTKPPVAVVSYPSIQCISVFFRKRFKYPKPAIGRAKVFANFKYRIRFSKYLLILNEKDRIYFELQIKFFQYPLAFIRLQSDKLKMILSRFFQNQINGRIAEFTNTIKKYYYLFLFHITITHYVVLG